MVLHLVILVGLHLNGVAPRFKLCLDGFRLFSLLTLAQIDGLLDFLLLILPLLLQYVVILTAHLLCLYVDLEMHDLLVHLILIAFLECLDLASALLSFLDLLPGLHFLLFEQSNTIGKQLSISLDSTKTSVII